MSVTALRSFARVFTGRIGALDESFLGQDRPLGQARLLWEIGAARVQPVDVAALRMQLDLDSGYLSRLLRRLEADGLVTTEPSPTDKRARTARLTAAGTAEWDELDQRSHAHAEAVLDGLDDRRRRELGELLARSELLLLAAAATFDTVDPRTPEAVAALSAYVAELDRRFPTGFDVGDGITADAPAFDPPDGAFVVVRTGGDTVGCGAVQRLGSGLAEIKRMWVDPEWRGLGLAPRLLAHLERLIRERGYTVVRLDTNSTLTEAIAIYERAGYHSIDRYNDNPYAQRWFEKLLR